ncbi:ArsR/SmtB family transcription factor [Acidihalobacter yilgarnensis]|uniref:ArsR/SmtB family transcription factor n=1 Tax=Acidihalobacter yilgarnensis TaxID=2819280 RepID=UPI0009F2C3C7
MIRSIIIGQARILPDVQHAILDHAEDLELVAAVLKAMGHPLRLRLLCTVGDSELCVNELVLLLNTTQTNVSQHLNILLRSRVMVRRRLGVRHYYRVNHHRTMVIIQNIRDVFCSHGNLRR